MIIRTQINSKLLSCLVEPATFLLKTCIPLESRFYNLTRLSLAEYSLYLGFVVLTPLQVLTVVMDIGRLSQTPPLSELTSEDHVKGKTWFLSFGYRYPLCVELPLKTLLCFPLLICKLL